MVTRFSNNNSQRRQLSVSGQLRDTAQWQLQTLVTCGAA